ncbi:MotA/TolQ/ExbB proton channel family protein [Mesonia sp. MT50]|uniref:MotA/TolQ/ExbB proton channel family protein n=1 Tax=Mesonia profundi TaxID=3070998 RepID=A0ABU1A0C4_9FLAO|nr:MotA/TolQ/ExbB proton channel family protein [Mesonia profundi]MDQ7917160.1 MotA/TolQ/ExbB proton channel family protein [Mesonia profundi]
MKSLMINAMQQRIFLSISDRFQEGGPVFMYTTLLILLAIGALFIFELIKGKNLSKSISLLSSLSLFALVWGFFGQLLGLIQVFDTIESLDNIAPAIIAGGIKITVLSPLFGMFTFLIGRVFIMVLTILKKEKD